MKRKVGRPRLDPAIRIARQRQHAKNWRIKIKANGGLPKQPTVHQIHYALKNHIEFLCSRKGHVGTIEKGLVDCLLCIEYRKECAVPKCAMEIT